MNIYCTLFDSNYLDKGLVLYHSLCACEPDFRLYVFAFDERCREVLEAEALEHMVVVSLSEFETPELQKVKTERTRAEYCWTCTPWTIRHVLERYREPMCTYIDADMMFYSSAQPVFDAMRAKDCSVVIVPHRLNRKKAHDRRVERHVGTYCVEFNTFVNDARGRAVLDWWAEQCLNWCFYTPDVDAPAYGDQKYLNEFPKRFPGVFVCEDWGVGMAPWNADRLKLAEAKPLRVYSTETAQTYPAVFFHFAGISFLTETRVNANSGISDPALHKALCDAYMEKLCEMQLYLRKAYDLEFRTRRVATKRGFYALYQKYLSSWLHLRRMSDIYRLP